jgi:hypothetical protein
VSFRLALSRVVAVELTQAARRHESSNFERL